MGYFRTMGTTTMGNVGKAIVKVKHTYFLFTIFSVFYFLFSFLRLYGVQCLNLVVSPGISNLSPSID